MRQISKLDLNVARKNIIAIRVAKYGGDATPILQMKIDRIPVDMEQIFERLSQGESCYSPVKSDMTGSGKILVTTLRTQHSGFVDNYRTEELEFLMSTLEPLSDGDENLFEVPVTGHEASHGFCTLLEKYSAYRGYRMNGEFFPKTDFAKYIGKSSERDGIVTGKIISTDALKISLSKI